MAVFVSDLERQLWLAAAAVLLAIGASLVWARSLADELRTRGLLDALFATALVMVLVAAVLLGWRTRPSAAAVGVWVAIAAAYLTALVRFALPEERTHLLEYGALALLLDAALRERRRHVDAGWAPSVVAVVVASTVGLLDEGVQLWLPDRVFDWRDVAFNVLAALMAVSASAVVRRVR